MAYQHVEAETTHLGAHDFCLVKTILDYAVGYVFFLVFLGFLVVFVVLTLLFRHPLRDSPRLTDLLGFVTS